MKIINLKAIILAGIVVKLVVNIFFTLIFTFYPDMKMSPSPVKALDIFSKVKKTKEKNPLPRKHDFIITW